MPELNQASKCESDWWSNPQRCHAERSEASLQFATITRTGYDSELSAGTE